MESSTSDKLAGSFRTRFKEHFLSYTQQNRNSKLSQRHQESRHSIGSPDEVIEIVQVVNEGNFINALETFVYTPI